MVAPRSLHNTFGQKVVSMNELQGRMCHMFDWVTDGLINILHPYSILDNAMIWHQENGKSFDPFKRMICNEPPKLGGRAGNTILDILGFSFLVGEASKGHAQQIWASSTKTVYY